MPLAIDNLHFDRAAFYTLSEAFDRVGRFRFPDHWTGMEIFAAPVDGLQDLLAEQRRIEEVLAQYAQERDRLMKTDFFMLADEQKQTHTIKEQELEQKTRELFRDRDRLPSDLEYYVGEQDAYKRRVAVELQLGEAFRTKNMTLRAAPRMLVDWGRWVEEPDFEVNFTYSWVVEPKRSSNGRRYPALILRSELDNWAYPFEVALLDPSLLTLEERVSQWLSDYVKATTGRPPKKEFVRHECLQVFSSENLSIRHFDRIWARDGVVPKSWKRSGPKVA